MNKPDLAPYRKNDQAWVEQKNVSVVRRLVGYGKHTGPIACTTLQQLYDASRLFVNFYHPWWQVDEPLNHRETKWACRHVEQLFVLRQRHHVLVILRLLFQSGSNFLIRLPLATTNLVITAWQTFMFACHV